MANTGTLQGGILFTSTNGGIFLLDGVNEYISTANQLNSNNFQSFTIGAWVRTTDSRGRKIIGFENTQFDINNSGYDRMLWVSTNGSLNFGNYSDGYQVISSPNVVNDDYWYYAVGSYSVSSGTMKLYVNGEKQPQELTFPSPIYPLIGWWKIGAYSTFGWVGGGSDGFLQGSIGGVHAYNVALTDEEILSNYVAKKDNYITSNSPTVVASTTTSSTIILAITSATDAGKSVLEYAIHRATVSTSTTWTRVGTTTTTSFSDTSAVGGTRYFYRAKFKQSDGKTSVLGTVSNGVTATSVTPVITSLYRNDNNEVGYFLQGSVSDGGVLSSSITREEAAKADWVMLQGVWQDLWPAEQIYLSQIKAIRNGVKLLIYNDPRLWYDDTPTDYATAPTVPKRTVLLNGAPELWKAKRADGTHLAHVWSPNNSLGVNLAATGVNSLGQTLPQAYAENFESYTQIELYDGFFLDDSNVVANNFVIRGTTTDVNWSYLQNGVDSNFKTDYVFGDAWRQSIKNLVTSVNQRFPNHISSINSGIGYWYHQTLANGCPPVPFTATSFAALVDISCDENTFQNGGLGPKYVGDNLVKNTYAYRDEFSEGNIEYFCIDTELYRLHCKPAETNRMGKRLAFLNQQMALSANDTPQQSDYSFGRFCWAFTKLARDCGVGLVKDANRPFFLDETCIKLGNIVGNRSLGTMNELSQPTTFTLRSPNFTNGGAKFYWQEYENALVVARMDVSGISYPADHGAGAAVSYTLPSAGVGKKWQRPNAATYVHPDYADLAMQNQSPSLNNGADATTSSLKPQHGEVFLRVNA